MISENKGLVIYESQDGNISFNVTVFDDNVWLNQKQISLLFNKDRKTITEHINNIYDEGEWEKKSTSWNFQLVQKEGNRRVKRKIEHYNLDVIISVGYRVKSQKGTQFRQWATKVLKQHLVNGYSVNDNRIKQIQNSLNYLVESDKIKSQEIDEIKDLLKSLVLRPIIINNNVSMTSKDLESKIVELIDKIIDDLGEHGKENLDINKFKRVQRDLEKFSNNKSSKNRILKFFKELGDDKSTLSKRLRGVSKIKKSVEELMRLLDKLL